jgi:tetratricopeptide (TPR) repeat protein
MSTHSLPPSLRPGALAAAVLLAALCAAPAFGQGALSDRDKQIISQEMKYVEMLNKAGFSEYAELVLRDVQAKYPAAKAVLKVKMLEQVLLSGNFEEAQQIIDKEPNQDAPETWAMKLTMADYLFARGRYDDAFGTYNALFKKYGSSPPESIVEFYVQSYYKFAQMLKFQKKEKEAADALEKLLAVTGLPADMKRPVLFEQAELLVKLASEAEKGGSGGYITRANKAIEQLLWTQDVWFGRSVALMAHIKVIEGKVEDAQKLVEDYMPMLKQLEDALIQAGEEDGEDYMGLSPIPECRYLMGVMYQEEADKLIAQSENEADKRKKTAMEDKAGELYGLALSELINVYIKYPSYAWAIDAMARHEKINKILDDLGFEVADSISPAQRAQVAKKQFESANMLYHQNQFEKAIAQFENVLKTFPEVVPDSINALGTLCQAALEFAESQEDEAAKDYWTLYSETVAGYLAERFPRQTKEGMRQAGDALRVLTTFYMSHNLPEVAANVRDDFFRLYPEHPAAANTLMQEAERIYKDGNYEEAMPKYRLLMENYQKNSVSWVAQRRLADCYGKTGRPLEELNIRSNYLARVEGKKNPGPDLITAQYTYLKCLRTLRAQALRDASVAYDEAKRGEAQAEEGKDPVAEATEALKKANDDVRAVVNEYTKLIGRLGNKENRAKYETNAQQKKLNDQILQSAFFDHAFCLASLNLPEANLPKYKQIAIKDYEKILELFPDAQGAPIVLLQLGTLYSTIRTEDEAEAEANTKKASEYFDRLSKDYPDSEQAKNALYLQAKALMDLGYRPEAIKKYSEMISATGGKYTPLQLANAAEELVAAKAWEQAEKGFQAALAGAKPEDSALRNKIELGLSQILVAQKKYPEAVAKLKAFVEANPRYHRVAEALELLRTACVEAAVAEPDKAKRSALFKDANKASADLKPYRRGERAGLELQLQHGDIMEKQWKAAVDFKADDADDILRTVANYYQRIVTSYGANPKNAEIFQPLSQAYLRSIRTLRQMKAYSDGTMVWPDVRYECALFLKLFPNADPQDILAVRGANNEATREINAAGEDVPESTLVELMGEAPDMDALIASLPPMEQLVPEEAPAEETPAEEVPAEGEAPAEEAPAEGEAPAAEAPAEAGETPAEAAAEEPAEEAPAEE